MQVGETNIPSGSAVTTLSQLIEDGLERASGSMC